MYESGKIEDTTGPGPSSRTRPGPPGVPRWVKVFAAASVALLVLVAAVLLVVGGGHGPSRHTSSGQPFAQPAADHQDGAVR